LGKEADAGGTLDVTGAPQGIESYACCATPQDGVNWEKPTLGLAES
jgi:hypothetical protein